MGKKVVKSKKKYILITILVILALIILTPVLTLLAPKASGNVAIIPIKGIITEEGKTGFGETGASSTEIVEFLQAAEKNPLVKVIVLDINSPGGSAVASDEIAEAVKQVNKPTVAVIHEVGASGAYWIASAADHSIANRMSITGSIGVLSSYLQFSQLMEEYGVKYEQLTAGEKKDIGNPLRKLKPSERLLLQNKIDKIHEIFIKEVAKNRNLDVEDVKFLATGEFYLGVESVENGLIDELGGMEEAEKYITNLTKIEDVKYIHYETKKTFLDVLASLIQPAFFQMGAGISSNIGEEINSNPQIRV